MKDPKSYSQFCPVSRAAEIVASRWTPVLLRELLAGSTRFNDLRIGLARMSPSLLSKRLAELEDAGVIRKEKARSGKGFEYHVTEIGRDLSPFVTALGVWGQKHVLREFAKHELDPGLLMWDVHRRIDASHFPEHDTFVAEFFLRGAPASRRRWWILVKEREVELCMQSPNLSVDLRVEADHLALTEIWMGRLPIDEARRKGLLDLKGTGKYVRSFKDWFLLSPFAGVPPARLGADA